MQKWRNFAKSGHMLFQPAAVNCEFFHELGFFLIFHSVFAADWMSLNGIFICFFQAGDYSVSLKAPGRNKHFRVQCEAGLYCIGHRKFSSLQQLVEHYQKAPIYTSQRGEKLFLIRPLPKWSLQIFKRENETFLHLQFLTTPHIHMYVFSTPDNSPRRDKYHWAACL